MQPTTWRRIAWIALVLLLPAVIIHQYYAKVFTCPSCFQFLDTGDGLKNYYTFAWSVIHDSGWHFTGMNYPYGEHVIYTDNQPLLALLLQWVHNHITPLDRHIIGIMNIMLLLSVYMVGFSYCHLCLFVFATDHSIRRTLCIGVCLFYSAADPVARSARARSRQAMDMVRVYWCVDLLREPYAHVLLIPARIYGRRIPAILLAVLP
jgi:hypothetical protein